MFNMSINIGGISFERVWDIITLFDADCINDKAKDIEDNMSKLYKVGEEVYSYWKHLHEEQLTNNWLFEHEYDEDSLYTSEFRIYIIESFINWVKTVV